MIEVKDISKHVEKIPSLLSSEIQRHIGNSLSYQHIYS